MSRHERPSRSEVILALDEATVSVRNYVCEAPDQELPGLVGILSELIHVRARFETATNPLARQDLPP